VNYDVVSLVADGAVDDTTLAVSLGQLPAGYLAQFQDGSFSRPVEIDGNEGVEILVRRDVRQSVLQVIRAANYQVV
jgi:hypothetical protein